MQQLVILLIINCSSTCFGRLYAHHHEVRLRFTAYGFLSYCSCYDVGESGGKLCALCGVGSQATYSTQWTQLTTRLSNKVLKQSTPHSAHSLPPDSPRSQQLQQDRKP